MGTTTQHTMESSDNDWINRRWQGEGEVTLREQPKVVDHEKLKRLAQMRDAKDLDGNAGRHCQHEGCNCFDYLPTECSGCGKYCCGAHADCEAHGCERQAIVGDKRATTCMLCNQAIHVDASKGESADLAMDRHIESGCKSHLAEKVREHRINMNRCCKKGCKESPLVPFKCGDCGKNFCIKHRFTDKHKCKKSTPKSLPRRLPVGMLGSLGSLVSAKA